MLSIRLWNFHSFLSGSSQAPSFAREGNRCANKNKKAWPFPAETIFQNDGDGDQRSGSMLPTAVIEAMNSKVEEANTN